MNNFCYSNWSCLVFFNIDWVFETFVTTEKFVSTAGVREKITILLKMTQGKAAVCILEMPTILAFLVMMTVVVH